MDQLLGVISILGFLICLIMIAVSAVKKSGKTKKWAIGLGACFVLFVVAVAMPDDTSSPSTTAPQGTTATDSSKISSLDKDLLKKSYSDFDSAQRTQFAEIESKYKKLSDTEKEEFKADFERLTKEQELQVAKWAEEEKAKVAAKEAEEKAAAEAKVTSLKSEAQAIPYKDLARNPDTYKGKSVKYTGKVIQVQEDSGLVGLRVNVTKNSYGYEDTVYIMYSKDILPSRVLEDDIITFYGTSGGLLTYKTVMGSEMSIPQIFAQIVEIN